jgi:hypothetical protein
MSFLTGTSAELIYASKAAGTAKNTFTTEVTINDTAGMGVQCHLPADFWLPNGNQIGRGIRIEAQGILSTTATPTFTFTIRAGAAGNITAAILLGSAALTGASTVTNVPWRLEGNVILEAIGAAGANSTVRGTGMIISPGLTGTQAGINAVYGAAASPGTVATLDTSIVNYINFNVACSASSASNGVTIQQLLVFGLN